MIPRIEAGETLAAVNTAALCHNLGFENDRDRERVLAAIERKAAGAPPPVPVKADPADLAGMGIGVKIDGETPTIDDLDAWLGNGADHG